MGAIAAGCQTQPNDASPWNNAPLAPLPNNQYLVRVNRVVSGHTIEVQSTTNALNQTIRLIGIQAPDRSQTPWGEDSQAYLETLLLGQTVQLSFGSRGSDEHPNAGMESETIDDYGRQWAYVWFNDQLVNQQLLADGMVLLEERSPHLHYGQQFSHAQHRARILGLGLWNPENPMRQTPREFRQHQN